MFILPQGGIAPYQIINSLRFDGANDYLTRTPAAASDRTKWTWSGWVKRSKSGEVALFGATIDTSNKLFIRFDSTDKLDVRRVDASVSTGNVTLAVFRDFSAWYHVVVAVDTTQAAALDRARIYVNGVIQPITSGFGSGAASVNYNAAHQIGYNASSFYFDGYLSEINFIDGQALDPSYFGATDPVTGQWKPKKYTGSYGTNGFYLDFKDGSSTTTLGQDKSGNGNNWTLTNMVRSAGVTDCWMTDTPTNNYAVYNKLSTVTTATISNGALDQSASTIAIGGVGMSTGSWYWEVTSTGGTTTCGMYSTAATATTTVTTATTKGFRFDASAGTFDWTSNGSSWTSIAAGLTSGPYFVYTSTAAATTSSLNHGQRAFAYSPPAGYKALCTANLPTPAILNPANHFQVKLDTGANIKTTSEAVFPSNFFEWIKDRGNVNNHQLLDIVRGASAVLRSNATGAETTYAAPTGSSVGWIWKADGTAVTNNAGTITSQVSANTTAGFSIVTYSSTRTAAGTDTVGHGLNTPPKLVISKSKNNAGIESGNWFVWHASAGTDNWLRLNTTDPTASISGSGGGTMTAPSSSVFYAPYISGSSINGNNYVAYCFAEVPGFSKIGLYTGNGLADGVFVYTGFLPAFILIKSSTAADDWRIYDNTRPGYNVHGGTLLADSSAAETTAAEIDFTSNGFKLRVATTPNAAQTYIYAAFAQSLFANSGAV